MERIVLATSNPGDLVLAPTCGTGNALAAAKKHGRRYLGIDVSEGTAAVEHAVLRPHDIPS